jgi:hypothetical protein
MIAMPALTRATFLAETRKFGDLGRYIQFSGVNLRDCDLSRLDLRNLNFRDAWLVSAHLDRSDLTFADLRGANLSGASVRGANLRAVLIDAATDWQGVIADPDTQWPKGFRQRAAACSFSSSGGMRRTRPRRPRHYLCSPTRQRCRAARRWLSMTGTRSSPRTESKT